MKRILSRLLLVLLPLALLPTVALADAVLPIPETFQEHSLWCWAGSADGVLRYHGNTQPQCAMANFAWGRTDCCGGPTFSWSHPCNQPNDMFGAAGSLQEILANWGVNSTAVDSHLSQSDVTSEIDAGRPFILRYGWTNGSGHFIVGRGIQGNMVYLMDPWPGEGYSIVAYSSAVSSSRHDWTHSLKTSGLTPPPADVWKTEIGIVNRALTTTSGVLRGFNSSGTQVWSQNVSLPALGRTSMDVTQAAGSAASQIKSMRFDISSGAAVGYQKFYQAGKYRVGLEALPRANQSGLYLPHIDSSSDWWTGVGMVNTTPGAKNMQINFSNRAQASRGLGAGAHDSFVINNIVSGTFRGSATVTNGAGIAGLLLFGSTNQLSGVSLSDNAAHTLVFPHVDQNGWWTGFGVYNPNPAAASVSLKAYDRLGNQVETDAFTLQPYGNHVASTAFSSSAAWFAMESPDLPIMGFQLFGTTDGRQLAGYSVVDLATEDGVFPKLEPSGWTGIAVVNITQQAIRVELYARNDAGQVIASNTLSLGPGEKKVGQASEFFSGRDLSRATYISFVSDNAVVGFQLNGSSDNTMLDAIPALGSATYYGASTLYFPHIDAQ